MRKILTIDDDPAMRRMISAALASRGYQSLEADNGHSGMELALVNLPDLIISDVEMPRMDGRAFLSWLRNDPLTADVPVILMTGHVDHTPHRVGMNLGADDYLPKPFTIADLLDAVASRLKKQTQLRELTRRKLSELSVNLSAALPAEFLSPLGEILSHVQVMRLGAGAMETSELMESLEKVEQSAVRLHRSLQSYLLYAEVELLATRPMQVAAARLRRTRAAHETIGVWAASVAERFGRSADLVLNLGECSAPLDPTYLAKVTEILAETAFKHSPPGTPVTIAASTDENSFILAVKDHGREIESEPAGADQPSWPHLPGEDELTSLGSAIVARLAQIHGGSFDLRSDTGGAKNSEFSIPIISEVVPN